MSNLIRKDFSGGWYPSADAVAAPPNVLLRADNLTLDERGVVSLRQGSAKINGTAMADTSIHSLHTAVLNGTRYRMTGAGDHVYSNLNSILTFDGSGDIAMGDAYGQVFLARGTTKKKWAGSVPTNWGIATPPGPPTVQALDPYADTIATFDTSESPAFTADEGSITGTFPTGADGTANGSLELTPGGTGRGTVTKIFTTDQDFLNIVGIPGDDRDIFDTLVWITEPESVEKITYMIGLGTGADPFQDDYYWFDFNIGGSRQSVVDLQDTDVLKDVVRDIGERITDVVDDPVPAGPQRDPDEVADKIQDRRDERRKERGDKAYNPGWTHLSCLRGQFNRSGNTSGRNWSTVRALKVVYKAAEGSTGAVRFDTARMIGGAFAGALTGRFKFRFRAVKDYDQFIEVSPPSSPTPEIELVGQRARVNVPLATLQGLDSQADTVWVYFYGGVLDQWYRCGTSPLTGSPKGMRIDEFPPSNSVDLNASSGLYRFMGVGIGLPAGQPGVTEQLGIDITTGEIEAMFINETLDDAATVPPDNIIGFIPEHYDRTLVLSQASGSVGYLYASDKRRPGLYSPQNAFRLGHGSNTLYWIHRTTGGAYVGTGQDIFYLEGTGDDLADGTIDFSLRPLNIGSPPVDSFVAAEGNIIIYRAADGPRVFDGQSSNPVPREAVDLLFRGYTRHGVSPLNLTTGRYRGALSNGLLTMLAPEGASTTSTQVLYVYNFRSQKWERQTYPNSFAVLHREPDGTVIAGDTSGFVWTLRSGTDDNGTAIAAVLWPIVDDDLLPLNRKEAFDLTLQMDTGNVAGSVGLHLDGSGSASSTITPTCNGMAFWKHNVASLSAFRHFQPRITGSFSTFKFYGYNLAYRPRPQHRMYVDTGYVKVEQQDITWDRECRVMVVSAANLTATPYFDDTAQTASTITATAGKTKMYTVPLGREIAGGTPRLTLATASSNGTSEAGFEVYWIEFKYAPSGNESQKKRIRVFPE